MLSYVLIKKRKAGSIEMRCTRGYVCTYALWRLSHSHPTEVEWTLCATFKNKKFTTFISRTLWCVLSLYLTLFFISAMEKIKWNVVVVIKKMEFLRGEIFNVKFTFFVDATILQQFYWRCWWWLKMGGWVLWRH
jgi:hypothetical protein